MEHMETVQEPKHTKALGCSRCLARMGQCLRRSPRTGWWGVSSTRDCWTIPTDWKALSFSSMAQRLGHGRTMNPKYFPGDWGERNDDLDMSRIVPLYQVFEQRWGAAIEGVKTTISGDRKVLQFFQTQTRTACGRWVYGGPCFEVTYVPDSKRQ